MTEMPIRDGDVQVSGIKPTGVPHLGNLFGMMRPAVRLVPALLFVADQHALTTVRNGLRGRPTDVSVRPKGRRAQ